MVTREEILILNFTKNPTQSRARTRDGHEGLLKKELGEGLPLFEWHPACEIIAFPSDRQLEKVRLAARSIVMARTSYSASKNWARTVSRMRSAMKGKYLSDQAIDVEIRKFAAAVDAELDMIDAPWRIRRANGMRS